MVWASSIQFIFPQQIFMFKILSASVKIWNTYLFMQLIYILSTFKISEYFKYQHYRIAHASQFMFNVTDRDYFI
jgi:hypothetical protein